MNLDNDDKEEAQEAMQDTERTAMEQLEKSLSQCQKCGLEKSCKIDNGGTHTHITFQQCQSWSIALVSTCAVTQ
jgi:hypothetical protein